MDTSFFTDTTLGSLILILLIGSAVCLLFSFIAYWWRLHKALENERKQEYTPDELVKRSQAHTILPSPGDTSGFLKTIIIITLLIYLCITNTKLMKTTEKLNEFDEKYEEFTISTSKNYDQLLQQLCYEKEDMKDFFRELYQTVDRVDASIQGADFDKNTCDIDFAVFFKEISMDATVQLVLADNTTIDLQAKNDHFVGRTTMPLFNNPIEDNTVTVIIREGQRMKTEMATASLFFPSLYTGLLPTVTSNVNLTWDQDDEGCHLDGASFSVDTACFSPYAQDFIHHISAAEVVYSSDGREIDRQNLPTYFQTYDFSQSDHEQSLTNITLPNDKLGSDITVTLVLHLENGYVVNYVLAHETLQQASPGELHEFEAPFTAPMTLLDPNGKVILEQ